MRPAFVIRHSTLVALCAVAALGVVLFVTAAASMNEVGFPLDDAWIHQTYARNLALHGEWAFVHGMPSSASTSPLYTVLLAVGYVLGVDFYLWTFVLGAVALAATGMLATSVAQHMYPAVSRVGVWTGLSVVTTWHLIWAAASGMETLVFSALSLGMVWLAWHKQDMVAAHRTVQKHFADGVLLGVVGALLTLARPEGVGLVGLTLIVMAGVWSPGIVRDGQRSYAAWAGGVCTGWLLGVLPYLALNYSIEGTLLPNTSAAKQAEYAAAREQSLVTRYARLLLPVMAGAQFALLPGIVFGVYRLLSQVRANHKALLLLLPLLWVCVDVTAYALRLPVAYQHGRYLMPVLSHLILYGVGGTVLIVRQGRRTMLYRVLSRTLALVAILLVPGFLVIGARQYGADVRIINTEIVAAARWVEDNLPADDLLAVHDIGAIGYFAPRPILDLAGLVSPEVVPIIRDPDALMRLMCRRNVRYLMVFPDQRPVQESDPRLGQGPVFVTGAPYAPAAGGSNMEIYALEWVDSCE